MKRFFRWFAKPQPQKLDTASSHHDLSAIYAGVNAEYFEGKLKLPFSWFGRRRIPRVKFRFGYYNLRSQSIFVHRMLDCPLVPQYCVAYILYHEMLHHVLPPIRGKGGRRQIHHAAFTAKDKEFRDYKKAQEFLQDHFVMRASSQNSPPPENR